MPQLIQPTARLHKSWLDARDEWGEGAHMAGSGLSLFPDFDLTSAEGFRAWTERLVRQSDTKLKPGNVKLVPSTFWWVVEGDDYLGAIDLRHRLNDFLAEAGGHVGYGIRPSARGRGLATWALGQVVVRARGLGVNPVLITCDEDNAASAKTIERNGGVLESIRDSSIGRKRRYWITF